MVEKVYFVKANRNEAPETLAQKIKKLYHAAGFKSCIDAGDLVAVKMHFGEKGSDTHVQPHMVRPLIEQIKTDGGKPFLTDTNVLYKSARNNAVDHLELAQAHGFTMENVGAPVVIGDGLLGRNELEVEIPGKLFSKVSIAAVALDTDAMIVVTHATGHMGTGFGGALKNLGMGLASRMGKLRQHSAMLPQIKESSCTGCGVCMRWCPVQAIEMRGSVAFIRAEDCIGCGECLVVCRFDAVQHDWKTDTSLLQKRMAEHALGAVINKKGKVAFMSFLISITKDCDCIGRRQSPIVPDIGILAGMDPVAIDTASLDLIRESTGKELADSAYPQIDYRVQLQHAQEIGLGKMAYQLVEV